MDINEALNLLNLNFNYNEEILKKAYKKEMKNVHPDINPNLTNANELTQNINEAYNTLKKQLTNYTRTDKNSSRKYSTDYNTNLERYKQLVLKHINSKINKLNINMKYANDYYFNYYKSMLIAEQSYYINLSFKIKYNTHYIDNINQDLFKIQLEEAKLTSEFIDNLFSWFIFESNNLGDYMWLKNKCIKYACNYKGEKTINDCMEYYINVKLSIIQEFVTNKINLLILKLSPQNKIYLNDNSREFLVSKILEKYIPETILKSNHIISNEFAKYIKIKRKEYIKFLFEKRNKILKLNFLIKKNRFDIDNKQFKSLKLERKEDKFNEKYLLFKDELQELLNLESNKIKSRK